MKLLATLAAALPLLAADHPDITGTWTLDIAKSNFGARPAPDSMVLIIAKNKNLLKISQTSKTPNDERVIDTECKTDGRFHPVDGPVGGSVRCKFDGQTLVGEKELTDGSSKVTMRFTIDPGGSTAVEQLHITGTAAGDSTLVWKR